MLFILLGLLGVPAFAADFSVNPVSLYFDAKQAKGTINIKNNEEEKLALQLSVFEWTQDRDGIDKYQPSDDFVIYPKILNLNQLDERIVRVGTKVPQAGTEKTYRLFFEEIPQPSTIKEGSNVRTLMRIGIPLFVVPINEDVKAEIGDVTFAKGAVNVPVRNAGNYHFVIQAVAVEGLGADGSQVFNAEQSGWYLLEGNSKMFTFSVPGDDCLRMKALNIDLRTDKLSIKKKVDANPAMCSQ